MESISRRHSRFSAALAACLGVLCTAGLAWPRPAPRRAAPTTTPKRAARAVDRAEAILEDATVTARNAARRLEAATAALPAAQKKVATSRGVVAAASVQADTARRKADAARAAYDEVAGRLRAGAGPGRRRPATGSTRSPPASYMGGNFAAINVLVGATGPQDAMDRLGLVDQVMQKQQEGVDELIDARGGPRVPNRTGPDSPSAPPRRPRARPRDKLDGRARTPRRRRVQARAARDPADPEPRRPPCSVGALPARRRPRQVRAGEGRGGTHPGRPAQLGRQERRRRATTPAATC